MPIPLPPPFTEDLPYYPFRTSHSCVWTRAEMLRIQANLHSFRSAGVAVTSSRSFAHVSLCHAVLKPERITVVTEDEQAYEYLVATYPNCNLLLGDARGLLGDVKADAYFWSADDPTQIDKLIELLHILPNGTSICAEVQLPPPLELALKVLPFYRRKAFRPREFLFEQMIAHLAIFVLQAPQFCRVEGAGYAREDLPLLNAAHLGTLRGSIPALLENASRKEREALVGGEGPLHLTYESDLTSPCKEYLHMVLHGDRKRMGKGYPGFCRVSTEEVPIVERYEDGVTDALIYDMDPAYLKELPVTNVPQLRTPTPERGDRIDDLWSDPYLRVLHAAILRGLKA